MKNAIASFVIINNSLKNGQDSISAFIPFMIRLFDLKDYASVDIEAVCQDFAQEYGIQLPRHPTETILNRMKPQYLTKTSGKFFIKKNEIRKSTEKIDLEKETSKYNALLENFAGYCRDYQIPVDVSLNEADILFTNFLKDHDLDIIFAAYFEENFSLIPDGEEIKDPDKIFLLNKYVNLVLKKNDQYAEYLLDSAIGHKCASLILYREFSNIRGKGACANYYLDSGILFDLTGINKVFRKKAAEDFLSMLRAKGSNLWIFPHNRAEFLQIIEGCLTWIESDFYDPIRANRSMQHFKDQGYGYAEVQLFIQQVQDVLDFNYIKLAPSVDHSVDEDQIGKAQLQKIILEVYNQNGHIFDEDDREDTLERDLKSIENIYKLRKGKVPINLNETSHVFITTNPGLAYAASKFEQVEKKHGYFTIPAVLTDTFVGTTIWVQEPTMLAKDFNRSKLISYTNAVLQPRAMVMSRFAQEVERARKNVTNPISDESAYLLLNSGLARTLLAEKILGDSSRITDQTSYEVLDELRNVLVAEEREKSSNAVKEAELKGSAEIKAKQDLFAQTNHTTKLINKITAWVKFFVTIMLIVLAFLLYGATEFQQQRNLLVKYINVIFSVYVATTGVTIFLLAKAAENFVRRQLEKILLANPIADEKPRVAGE